MRHDAAWHARISCVLSGVLRVWGVRGCVARDPHDAAAFIVAAEAGPALRVRHEAPAGWIATPCNAAASAPPTPGRHAGLPGLLRELREQFAPHAPAGRLLIGAQPLLEPHRRAP